MKAIPLQNRQDCPDLPQKSETDGSPLSLPFDTNQWPQASHLACQSRLFRGIHHRANIFVRTGRFLGHAAQGWTANQDAMSGQGVDHGAAFPASHRLVAAQAATRAVNRGAKGTAHALGRARQYIGRGPHAAADQHRLAN